MEESPRVLIQHEHRIEPIPRKTPLKAVDRKSLYEVRDCTTGNGATLRDAMLVLERNAVGIVLCVDEFGRLLGTLTDGDVRRALLSGADLGQPADAFMARDFVAVSFGSDRSGVLDLMRARGIQQIPIIDGEGRLCGLHLLREMISAFARPNWAVIMAGGEGKRLRPLTESVPKPMLRVAGRPILERIVLQLVGFGIERIFLAINYLGHTVEEYFGNGDQFGCHIEYLKEGKPLGTAGALGLLPEAPHDPVLLMNGDLVTQANFGAILDFHRAGDQIATMGIRRYLHSVPFGCVELDGRNVLHIEEKPCASWLVNCGIYVLNPEFIAGVRPGMACGVPELLMQSIKRGARVCGFEISDDWIDVGRMEHLELAIHGS